MAGAALETHVFAELYKSWLHRLRRPNLYYFRDRDANEIDFLFIEDGTMHPVEVKKSAAVKRTWESAFRALERFPEAVGHGAVVCLVKDVVPVTQEVSAIPVGLI